MLRGGSGNPPFRKSVTNLPPELGFKRARDDGEYAFIKMVANDKKVNLRFKNAGKQTGERGKPQCPGSSKRGEYALWAHACRTANKGAERGEVLRNADLFGSAGKRPFLFTHETRRENSREFSAHCTL